MYVEGDSHVEPGSGCSFCRKKNHVTEDCEKKKRYMAKTCTYCKKNGHLEDVCRRKLGASNNSSSGDVNSVVNTSEPSPAASYGSNKVSITKSGLVTLL